MATKTAAAKSRTKSEVYSELAAENDLSRKQIAGVFDGLANLIKRDLGKKGPGVFTVPGLMKIRVVRCAFCASV